VHPKIRRDFGFQKRALTPKSVPQRETPSLPWKAEEKEQPKIQKDEGNRRFRKEMDEGNQRENEG